MEKRERLEKTIAAEATDRAPIAIWRYFPGDDLRAADLAQSIVDFQRLYDWDLVVVYPASTYQVLDYGIQEQWHGSLHGRRSILRHKIQRSLDWTELRALDPGKGSLARQTEALRLIADALPDIPLVLTIHSALDQALMLSGQEALVRCLRTQPDRLRTGLNILTENTLRFTDTLKRLPLAGIALVCSSASFTMLSEEEYRLFGYQYDRALLTSLGTRWWLNIVQLDSDMPMFKLMSGLPAQVMQWRDRDTEPDLAFGKSLATGAVCCGVSAEKDLYLGTPNTVRDAVRDAQTRANHRRLIISTGEPMIIPTPYSHLRAARLAVEPAGV